MLVAPLAGAWIEIVTESIFVVDAGVALLAGA